jgi:hypothetical protein
VPNRVAVSPPGGPQPAKNTAAVVRRAVTNLRPSLGLPPLPPDIGVTASTPAEAIAMRHPAAVAAITGMVNDQAASQWKPNSNDLYNWLYAHLGNVARPTTDANFPLNDPLGLLSDRKRIDAVLAASGSPAELARNLGVRVENLDPFLQQQVANNAALDQRGQQVKDQVNQAYNESTPPAQGGMTPDSIDRAPSSNSQSVADALSMLTPAPAGMDSNQIDALISQLDSKSSTNQAMMLNEVKRQVMSDTAAAMADSQRLAEVYRAGAEGRPMPALPAPGESTDQGRYKTAPRQAAQVANPTVVAPTLDTSTVEQQILMAAKGIEFQRIEEQRQKTLELLKSQQEEAQASQKAAEAERKRQAKDVAKGEVAVQRDAFDAQTRKIYTRDLKATAVEQLANTGVATPGAIDSSGNAVASRAAISDSEAEQSYKTARRLFLSGANFRGVVKQVFPDSLDVNGDVLPLTQGQYKLLQAARFAAGVTPDELATDWGNYRDAARVQGGYGVTG